MEATDALIGATKDLAVVRLGDIEAMIKYNPSDPMGINLNSAKMEMDGETIEISTSKAIVIGAKQI